MSFLNEANDIIGAPSQHCLFGSSVRVAKPLHTANVLGMLLCTYVRKHVHTCSLCAHKPVEYICTYIHLQYSCSESNVESADR